MVLKLMSEREMKLGRKFYGYFDGGLFVFVVVIGWI